jgi:hypothetical protein
MTRIFLFLLAILALCHSANGFNNFCGSARRFSTLKMSSEEAQKLSYQVFLGNLPFTLGENELKSMVSERVTR